MTQTISRDRMGAPISKVCEVGPDILNSRLKRGNERRNDR